MKKVWTCLPGSSINASPGSIVEPSKPRRRARHVRAQTILSASTSPVRTWVSRCPMSIRLVVQGIDQEATTTLTKWEYASVPLISHALQEILNQWGEEGWELVQVQESQSTGTVAFLKRPKQEGSGS